MVLTIAGSDSGGGAGIEADLHAIAAHGAHGVCAITAVTAQNTCRVAAVETMAPRVVAAQIDALFEDFEIGAAKIGMLATPAIVRVVATALARRPRLPVVLDPVLVATSGGSLARSGLVAAIRRHLLARADLVTPNVPEAASLLERPIETPEALAAAGRALLADGARAVLLKGAHLGGRRIRDVLLIRGREPLAFEHARIAAEGHGTGCTLSAAIASNLALGAPLPDAVRAAIGYVQRALAAGDRPGRGRLRVLEHRVKVR